MLQNYILSILNKLLNKIMIPNMMPNMFPNNQNFNNFNNNFNNIPFMMNNGMNMNMNMNNGMNMNNMCVIPNQNMNMNMPRMNIGGNAEWMQIYNTQTTNQNNGDRKVNAILTTTKGIKVIMKIDFGKKVCDLIKEYFNLINREDLLQKPQDLCFIYNAKRMDFNDQTPVEKFFGSTFARITINDIQGLIGA